MKTIILAGLSMILLSSCEKEDNGPRLRREAEEKIMGKWTLDRRVSDVYSPIVAQPVPGTGATTEYKGNPNDYFQFSAGGTLRIDTASVANDTDFEVINPFSPS